ncbi:AlkZ family DNA glycosylase [Microbispora sp. RL4-1S]|uniref:AlkZ family DNA glycosylase n=1 Tax=Microbispora oryzae TaxID=2806554 RepID=A0A940WHF0_9ACTN|nr:winged helix DNA-binding domain-containing protein [Microbispora oryzae]MBP2703237.1 AlkZ family DNA glycosylase [Microbispora oryzae]
MGAPRTLSQRELTASLFTRQLLHRDQALTAEDAVRRLAALQAQYSPSPHIALHVRLPEFDKKDLERALVDGGVVKSTLMRGTLHIVAADDYPHFAAAWRRQWLTEIRGRHKNAGVDEDALLGSLEKFTAEPRSAQDLRDHVHDVTGGAVRKGDLVHYARALVPLVHVAPSGHWRAHGKPSMVLWQGELEPEPAATARLVSRYLAAFGPASRADIAQFTYLRYRQIDPALDELDTVRYTAEDGRELVDLADAPLPPPDLPLPVRFLPKWDAALLSHADRTRILPEAIHKEVYKAINGECLATYLIDGVVAGIWDHSRTRDVATLTLRPLRPADGGDALMEEGERLLAFLEPDATTRKVEIAS